MDDLLEIWRCRQRGEAVRCDCGGPAALCVGARSYRWRCAACGRTSERLTIRADGGVSAANEPDAAFAREALVGRAVAALLAKPSTRASERHRVGEHHGGRGIG